MKVIVFSFIFGKNQFIDDMATHSFLYDDACPMCKGYTGVFTHLKWSERKAFSSLKEGEVPALDLDRGRHEIPLINLKTKEVRYGLDAMTTVISEAVPFLKPLLKHRLFITIFKPLYWLVTYNRRIIAGTKPPDIGFDCAPDYHPGWRWTYVGLMMVLAFLVGPLEVSLLIGFGVALLFGLAFRKDRLNFLGHFVTVLFMVSILNAIVPGIFGTVVTFIIALWEAWRRW